MFTFILTAENVVNILLFVHIYGDRNNHSTLSLMKGAIMCVILNLMPAFFKTMPKVLWAKPYLDRGFRNTVKKFGNQSNKYQK